MMITSLDGAFLVSFRNADPQSSAIYDSYSEEETKARAEAALKRMLATPPKSHSEMRLGKRKAKAQQKASLPKQVKARPSS